VSTLYVDLENGNDGNNGSTFALRKKTLASANSIAGAGDVIRVMASPDATSIGNATWNSTSKTVTLASALTANISLCETAWTAAVNVTTTANATRKQGSFSAQMAIAAAFVTGQVARESFSATDFSAYQQVSFWFITTVAIAASTLELRLCSDAAGLVTVNTIPIPAVPNVNLWTAITFDNGAALGNSIQSVVLQALLDPGTVTVRLDNILACKASASADSLNLNSVIGKNTAGETWFAIQSINGTNVLLDANPNSLPTVGRGYSGVTETVTTYKREPIQTALATSATNLNTYTNSGTDSSPIVTSGGWNRTDMSTQTGETHVTGRNGSVGFLTGSTIAFLTFSKISLYRYTTGMNFTGGNTITFDTCHLNNNTTNGLISTVKNLTMTSLWCDSNGGNGITIQTQNNEFTTVYCDNNVINGLQTNAANFIMGTTLYCRNNGSYGIQNTTSCSLVVRSFFSDTNATAGIRNDGGEVIILDGTLTDTTPVLVSGTLYTAAVVRVEHYNGSNNDNRTFWDIGNIVSVADSNRHTLSGLAWQFSPTSANASVTYPLSLIVARVACLSSGTVTVKIWVKRSSTGITARMFMRGGQIDGAPSDLIATASAAANTYEEISFSFTPTEQAVVEIELQVYGGTSLSAWFDDMTITQA